MIALEGSPGNGCNQGVEAGTTFAGSSIPLDTSKSLHRRTEVEGDRANGLVMAISCSVMCVPSGVTPQARVRAGILPRELETGGATGRETHSRRRSCAGGSDRGYQLGLVLGPAARGAKPQGNPALPGSVGQPDRETVVRPAPAKFLLDAGHRRRLVDHHELGTQHVG